MAVAVEDRKEGLMIGEEAVAVVVPVAVAERAERVEQVVAVHLLSFFITMALEETL